MYKVFIENTFLQITESKENIPSNAFVITEPEIELIRLSLFSVLYLKTNILPVYIVTKSPEDTFRSLFSKHEFIEAAGGIVRRKNSFLFIKRNGFWDIPKGKLEKNEKSTIAAVREIEEECGIVSPTIVAEIVTTYHTYLYSGRPTIKKTYWYALNYNGSKKVSAQFEEGITKVKWFKKDELDKVYANTFGSILEVLSLYFLEEN